MKKVYIVTYNRVDAKGVVILNEIWHVSSSLGRAKCWCWDHRHVEYINKNESAKLIIEEVEVDDE